MNEEKFLNGVRQIVKEEVSQALKEEVPKIVKLEVHKVLQEEAPKIVRAEIRPEVQKLQGQIDRLSNDVGEIKETMVTKDMFYTAQDEVMVHILRLEEEQTFMNAAITRIDEKVERHDKRLAVR